MRFPSLSLALVLTTCGGPDASSPGGPAFFPASAVPFGWTQLAPVPTPRTEPVAAVDGDGLIVLVGGFGTESQTLSTVEVYDPSKDRWVAGPSLPIAVDHAMASTVGGTIHVMGGYTSSGAPSSQAFALKGSTWQPLPPMPEPRAAGGAAAAAGKIYVAGGVGPSGLASSTLILDPGTGSWSTAPGLLSPREHLGVASFGDLIYVVGGRTGAGNLADAEVFEPAAGSWRRLPDMPTARGGLAGGHIQRLRGGARGRGAVAGRDDVLRGGGVRHRA